MPTQVQFRRGTSSQNDNFTGASGELTVDTTNQTIRVHDGVTTGGSQLATTTLLDSKASNAYTQSQLALKANITDLVTTTVTEGSNLYFTNLRATAAVTNASLSNITVSGNASIGGTLVVSGNLNVLGTTTTFNSNVIELNDPLIYLAPDNAGNTVDIGFVGSFTDGTYQHTGLVRDASDGVWKLFANVSTEPSNNTLNFTSATYPTLKIGTLEANAINSSNVINPTITGYVESVVASGTVTSSKTIDLTNGTVQTATLTASTACTFTMPTAVAGKSFILLLKQAASTGNGSATFTGVKWGTAGAPTITTTAGKMDILTFVSDGTNWYGSAAQGYTP